MECRRHAAYRSSLSGMGERISMARRERIDRKQWIFSSEIVSVYRSTPRLVVTVRAWSATQLNRLYGVLTLFAPTQPAVVARRSLSWHLLLTVVTGRLGDTSPLAWRDARVAWLYLSSHSSSFDSPVWCQASVPTTFHVPPSSSP